MKMKTFPLVMVVVLLFSVCVAGCKKAETQAPGVVVGGDSVTIIGGENQGADLSEGSFTPSAQTDSEKSNAKELAKLIEKEWFETYILGEQGMYNPNPILPEDLYVFDSSMSWFAVFTHETTDWETEDSMKEAESRYCIIYSEKNK